LRPLRITIVGAVVAVLAALLSTPAASSAATAARTSPHTSLGELVRVKTVHSLLGTHTWYRQTFHGLPVLGGYYAVHVVNGHRRVDDGRVAVPVGLTRDPEVASSTAKRTSTRSLAAKAGRQSLGRGDAKQQAAPVTDGSATSKLSVVGGSGARLVWRVLDRGAAGTTETVVDARSGAVVSQRSLVKNDRTGKGQVFNPNPVVALRNEKLTDKNDSNTAVPDAAYKQVPLSFLDNSGVLHGKYVRIMNSNIARSSTATFRYKRADDHFEQVSAYFDVTEAQKYLRSLGFNNVNNDAQKVFTDTIPDDNSFYDPDTDVITFGNGGVDDAEDQEVVWHELGHAIQDSQVPGFGSSEQGGAIGEGFGDYWAVTMSQPVSNGFDLPCVMDWDSTSYTSGPRHCLRRTDGTKTTRDIDGEVHDDGEIWSRALWDIHKALGRTKADKVIIESQFGYAPDTKFAPAARQVVQTARVFYGTAAADKVRQAFVARRILS
jgi:Zn-dependent metalloprotease